MLGCAMLVDQHSSHEKCEDNQNHAIIFLRGIFSQCIDANQGGYFEQMLMLPCVLGEFRTIDRGDDAAKQIIGLPEAGRVVVVVGGRKGREGRW